MSETEIKPVYFQCSKNKTHCLRYLDTFNLWIVEKQTPFGIEIIKTFKFQSKAVAFCELLKEKGDE